MKKKNPVYMYQCVVCDKNILTENTTLRHCGKLTQWVNGIPGKGIDMNSPIVKIRVAGWIEMRQEDLDRIRKQDDPHMALVYCIHMGYVNADNLEFTPMSEQKTKR